LLYPLSYRGLEKLAPETIGKVYQICRAEAIARSDFCAVSKKSGFCLLRPSGPRRKLNQTVAA
jgi:hypothetical protein